MSTYKKRSVISRIAEMYMKLMGDQSIFRNEEKMMTYMKEREEINSRNYVVPKNLKLNATLSSIESHSLQSFLLSPKSEMKSDTLILYFHGGAYVNQPVVQHWLFLDQIACESGMEIIVPIYPKAPNYTCLQSIDSLLDFYQKDVLTRLEKRRIVFMGDSAGGGLALAFYQWLKKNGMQLPDQLQLFSPWVDLSMEDPEIPKLVKKDPMLSVTGLKIMGKAWAGELDSKNPVVSPLFGDLEINGSVRIYVGTREILLPDSQRLRDKLRQMNSKNKDFRLEYEEAQGMNHVYVLLPIPEGKDAIHKIVQGLRDR